MKNINKADNTTTSSSPKIEQELRRIQDPTSLKNTRAEFKRLKTILPSIKQKDNVSKLDIILEAIKYIDDLQDQLIDRLTGSQVQREATLLALAEQDMLQSTNCKRLVMAATCQEKDTSSKQLENSFEIINSEEDSDFISDSEVSDEDDDELLMEDNELEFDEDDFELDSGCDLDNHVTSTKTADEESSSSSKD